MKSNDDDSNSNNRSCSWSHTQLPIVDIYCEARWLSLPHELNQLYWRISSSMVLVVAVAAAAAAVVVVAAAAAEKHLNVLSSVSWN
jgi:hypothetical protein